MRYHRDKIYLRHERLFKNIFRKRVDLANRYVKRGKVLEVGCSHGFMLDILKEKAFETWGIEPSESAITAKEKGHKIFKDYFEKAKLPKDRFDLIIMNHTLEHMGDPPEVLSKVYSLLKKDGILFVDVPNAGGLGARILGKYWPYRLPEEHKWQFMKESLSKIMKAAGFKIIHFESRSGLFDYANPFIELWESLTTLKKRFFTNILILPYSFVATALNVGDSMSIIGRKM